MTLNRKYDEVMDKIQVTPEMRRRILSNIEDMDFSEKKLAKVIRFPHIRRVAAIAACLAVVLVGALTLPNYLTPGPLPTDMVGNPSEGIVEVASVRELSQAVGFDVDDLNNLPFTPEQTAYLSYWQEMAEIVYTGEGWTATYRKAPGIADVSGDSNEYTAETVIQVDGQSVALRGTGEAYVLAIWNDGDYAYSLALSQGIPDDQWEAIIPGGGEKR